MDANYFCLPRASSSLVWWALFSKRGGTWSRQMAEVAANTAMETSTNGAAEAAATAAKANGTSGKKKHAVELSLESKLLARPSANELVGKNVLRGNARVLLRRRRRRRAVMRLSCFLSCIFLAGDVASAISAMQAEFQRTKLEDSLNRKLANRPSRERLVELNLMKGACAAPFLFLFILFCERQNNKTQPTPCRPRCSASSTRSKSRLWK